MLTVKWQGEKEGWLQKQSEGRMGIKIWQRRYFVLGRGSLKYFVKPDSEVRRVYDIDTIVEAQAGSKPTELQLQVALPVDFRYYSRLISLYSALRRDISLEKMARIHSTEFLGMRRKLACCFWPLRLSANAMPGWTVCERRWLLDA